MDETEMAPGAGELRAVELLAEMMSYRSRRIREIAGTVKKDIRHLHRERRAKFHDQQIASLIRQIDTIGVLVSDNEYDAHHLGIVLSGLPETEAPHKEIPHYGYSHDVHYIQ